jgi:hypothetical protein
MSQQVYDWKRFWCPRSSQINLGDRGYLIDPESEYGKHANPELVGLEAIANLPCLVLLGEPGIGKSQELINLKCHTDNNLDSGNEVLELNLRSCTNLKEDLFKDEQFISWESGTHCLYLFLDSLDEGLLQIQNLATQLVDTFTKNRYRDKLSRLYIRIACRTAVFPNILEEGLKELWEENNVGIYELAPLRRVDVQASVTVHCLDADAFLNEVDRKSVVPFALKPITLRFLLNTFQKNNGQFPADQKLMDLYLDGCRSLCEEQNQSRCGSRQIGKLDVTQRLMVAARIAAVTVFANRFAVWTEPNSGKIPREDVLLEKLCLGDEITHEKRFQITRDAIEEVLDTGFFSSRGSGRMGWSHQTYAEFLAAWYLKQRNLELSQILDLIIHPDHRVVPQLQETAAWLASMIPEVFQDVMRTDPDILIQSDISTVDNDNKAKLVKAFLQLHDDKKLAYSYFHILRYKNLDHPGLAEQLQPYICESTKSIWTRYVAIDIAEAFQAKDVQSSLIDIVLDPKQDYQLRVHAVSAACHLCDEETKSRLKPLALDDIEHDPEDDLKGYALQAVYPNHVSTGEVLRSLKSPNRKSFGGSYQNFLAKIFVNRFKLLDLEIALNWFELQPKVRDLHYPFDKLSDCILQKAWEHIEDSNILLSFAKVVFLRLQNHDVLVKYDYSEFKQKLIEDDNKRRRLIDAVILMLTESNKEPLFLVGGLVNDQYNQLSILRQDFFWLFKRLQRSKSKHIQRVYAKLIRQKLNWQDAESVSSIIKLDQYSSILKAEFPSELSPPIELGSARAKRAKAIYDKGQAFLSSLNRQNHHPLLEIPPKQSVLKVLERIEANQPDLWWQLPTEMSLEPTRSNDNGCDKPDLTKFPGWIDAEVDTRKRIIETAKTYLHVGQTDIQKTLNTNYFLSNISNQIWMKWTPIILKFTGLCFGDIRQDIYCKEILRRAYEINSDRFIDILIKFIHQHNYKYCTLPDFDVYRSAKDLLDRPLVIPVFEKLKDQELTAGLLEVILEDLFIYEAEEAKRFATSFIKLSSLDLEESKARAVVAACMLIMNHIDDSSWSILWTLIQENNQFGREIFESIAFQAAREGQIEKQLKEEYLADLYIFLSQQYPEVERPQSEAQELRGIQAQVLGKMGEVRMWKNYIPQRLQARESSEACDALRKIIRELPELADDMELRLRETEAVVRRNIWIPPHPEEILRLVIDQEPSNFISNKLEIIDQRMQKMTDEPRVDKSVHISNSKHIGGISTGDNNIKIDLPEDKQGFDWKFWLSISVTVMVALISVLASGVFNDEIKKFFNQNASPQIEQKLEKKTK